RSRPPGLCSSSASPGSASPAGAPALIPSPRIARRETGVLRRPTRGESKGEGLGDWPAAASRPAPHPNLLPACREKGPQADRDALCMRNVWSSLILLLLLCASACVGFFVISRLPERHRSRESIELV